MNWKIRPAKPGDLDAVFAIDQSAFDLFGTVDFDGFLKVEPMGEDDRQQLARNIECGGMSIAEVEGQVAGYVDARACDGGLYIVELSVHQDFGKRGIGRGLMEHVLKDAREKGYPFACLTTFTHLPWNRPFYETLGFETVSYESIGPDFTQIFEQQAEYLDREKRVAMRLVL